MWITLDVEISPFGTLRSAQVEARGGHSAAGTGCIVGRHPVGCGLHEHMPAVVQEYRQFLCAYVGGSPDSSPNGATMEEINNLPTQNREGGMAENIKHEAFRLGPDAVKSGN